MAAATETDRIAAGRERLAARARSVRRIRRRVAATSLAAFVLAWAAIAHGGSMGEPTQSTATATSTPAASTGTGTGADTDTTTSSDDSDQVTAPSPLTTAQS